MTEENFDTSTDDVRAAIAQLQNDGVAPEEPEVSLEAEPDEDRPDRARDGRGRFIVPPKAKEPDSKPAAETVTETPQPQAAKGPEPPARLSKEAKAIWNSVPPAIQAEWARMEADTQKGVEKLKTEHQQALDNWRQLEGIIAPRREGLKRLGYHTDVQVINELLGWSDAIQRDPVGAISFLAQRYGVPLNGMNGTQQQAYQPQQQYQQPQVDYRSAIREEIGLANAASEIEQFAGSAEYPHFQKVRPMMAQLLQSGGASTLEEAYEAAIWSNAELRQERMEQMQAEKAKADEQARAKVQAKKVAAQASLSGAPHGASPSAKKGNGRSGSHFDEAVDDVRAAIASLS